MRKKEFPSQKIRDEHQSKILEIENRLKSIKKEQIEFKTYNEALKEWIPVGHQSHIDSPSFLFLCQRLKGFLEEKNVFLENREALRLAKDNFEKYCEMKNTALESI